MPPAKRSKKDGTPYFEFQNSCMAAAKAIAPSADLSKAGALTDIARRRVLEDCKERWANMGELEKEPYKELFRVRQRERQERVEEKPPAEGSFDACASGFCLKSAWGMGSGRCAVHPGAVQAAIAQGARLPAYQQFFDPMAFAVPTGLQGGLRGDGLEVDACPLVGRIVCKTSANFKTVGALFKQLDHIARRAGSVESKACDTLVMLEGVAAPGASQRHRLFVLLTDVSLSPLCAYWTLCEYRGGRELEHEGLAFPFEVSLVSEASPLNVSGAADDALRFAHRASDELAQLAGRVGDGWRLHLLEYSLVDVFVMRSLPLRRLSKRRRPRDRQASSERRLRSTTWRAP